MAFQKKCPLCSAKMSKVDGVLTWNLLPAHLIRLHVQKKPQIQMQTQAEAPVLIISPAVPAKAV